MKKIICLLLACLPLFAVAQNNKGDKNNPKYLSGAITLDNKNNVTFIKEVQIPSKSKETLFIEVLEWSKKRFQPQKDMNARVLYTSPEKGIIAASGEEYLVFHSNAISLDRTRIYYQLAFFISDGKCKMEMNKIHYLYDENRDGGQRYKAEEWITDDIALNRKKTKLSPISGKFRRKTIDLKDELFESVINVLSKGNVIDITAQQDTKVAAEKVAKPETPVVVATATPNETVSAVQASQPATAALAEVAFNKLPNDLNEIASSGRITITVGEEEVDVNAESWGGFGKLFNKNVAYTLINKSRMAISLLMEHCDTYKVSLYKAGSAEADVVIECKKSMKQELTPEEVKSLNSQLDASKKFTMYIGEITRCMAK